MADLDTPSGPASDSLPESGNVLEGLIARQETLWRRGELSSPPVGRDGSAETAAREGLRMAA